MMSNKAPLSSIMAPWSRLGRPLKMGLQPCMEKDWLMAEDPFGDDAMQSRQITLKKDLRQDHHQDIFNAHPCSIDAGEECFDLIKDNLATHHNKMLEGGVNRHPIDKAAQQVPEDILLLCPEEKDGATIWVLRAASLAFPSHWVLAEKMNKPMASIHDPVPDYDKVLERPVDRFFNAMIPGTISLRRNWTLQIDDGLFTPERRDKLPLGAQEIGDRLHVRVERQTLRKMARTGWIIFTIQTFLAPIKLWKNHQSALEDLIVQIDALPQATQDYRGVDVYLPQLREWIALNN